MALLEIQALTKDFGGLRAVNNCSFSVEAATITGLIGPNGAGKTTVFNLICGLLKPDQGQILIDGQPIQGGQPSQITRKGISRTFQITRELLEMTVLENLIVNAPINGFVDLFRSSMPHNERAKAMELLDFVGIRHLASAKAKNLSFGQKKLIEFSAALMSEPRLVLLDEPAGGINPVLLERIMDRIRELNQQGLTFLIVEHNMDVVMNLCNPVIVMAYGKVIASGTPESIQASDEVLKAYLGEV